MDLGARRVGLVQQTYPALPESVAAIRLAISRFASDVGAYQRIADAIVLAVSEAATNVAMHAYRDTAGVGQIEVSGALEAGELVVTVRDAGRGLRRRADSPGLGLGLAIIAHVVDRLDLLESPNGGLEVRMYFVLAPAEA